MARDIKINILFPCIFVSVNFYSHRTVSFKQIHSIYLFFKQIHSTHLLDACCVLEINDKLANTAQWVRYQDEGITGLGEDVAGALITQPKALRESSPKEGKKEKMFQVEETCDR